jgi:Tfp pilus assembly protein FimV
MAAVEIVWLRVHPAYDVMVHGADAGPSRGGDMQAGSGLWSSFIGMPGKVLSPLLRVAGLTALLIGAACLPVVAQTDPVVAPSSAPPPAPSVPAISPQAQAALSQLLQIPAATAAVRAAAAPTAVMAPMAQTAPPAPVGSRIQVVVRPGETLDRLIQRTMRDSPFRVEVLRDAFVRLNRSAFPRGTPHWVLAGSVLQVPTPADLMAQVDPRWWPAPAPADSAPATSAQADRRNWVRYP